MKTLRKNTFETNSSSCHSLTYGNGGSGDILTPIVVHADGEYEWGYDEITDPETKLDYYFVDLSDYCNNKTDYMDKANKIIQYFKNCGVDLAVRPNWLYPEKEDDTQVSGDIDHQSCGTMYSEFENDISRLFEFVFDPESSIIIDNDNH